MIKKTLCFTTAAYLSLRNKQMVIRLPEVDKSDMPQHTKDDAVVTRPIEDIGFVILDNKQITITSGLLSALLENECAVVSCDENCMILNLKAIHNLLVNQLIVHATVVGPQRY